MKRPAISEMEHSRRRRLAEAIIRNGGSQAEFARQLGFTPPAALRWLRRYAPDLHVRFLGDRMSGIDRHTALVRLLLVREAKRHRGWMAICGRAFGLTPQALATFVNHWAPDGIDAAIEDLMTDDGGGHCQTSKGAMNRSAMELARG